MGRPPQYKTVKELQVIIDLYFRSCKSNKSDDPFMGEDDLVTDDEYPTVTGLALALDLTRQGLINYEGKDDFVDTIKRAKTKVESYVEQRLFHANAVGSIFNLKNNFGWKDRTEVESTVEINDISSMTDGQLEARRKAIISSNG